MHIKTNTYLNSMIQENIIGNTNNKFQVKFEIELNSETYYIENGIYFLKFK